VPGWLTTNFNDSNWAAAQKIGPVGMQPWGEVRSAENRVLPARYLRKEFAVEKKIARATVSFCGLGLSELYLNGGKIGNHVLSPAFAQYNQREFYVTYDVTRDLRSGANAMGIILGNGRYYADRSKVYAGTAQFGFPKLLLNLHIDYTDGSSSEIVSDGSWRLTTDGPILANNDYDGEQYDARKELPDWSKPRFDDTKWQAAQLVSAPGGVLSAEMSQPIRVTGNLKPISVQELRPDVFIFDMGQNMVGWCRLHVSGKAGDTVTLRHAETLKPDGSLYMANLRGAEVTDIYTLKGVAASRQSAAESSALILRRSAEAPLQSFRKQFIMRERASRRIQNRRAEAVGRGGGKFLEEIGERFLHARGVFKFNPGNFQSQNGKTHRHAMVVVGFDFGAVQFRGINGQRIAFLDDLRAAFG